MRTGPLLTGERILYRGFANAVIEPADYQLPDLPSMSDWSPLVLGTVKEAIGGRLHVTTCRVIFSSHPFNRVTGRISIPLSAISRSTTFREGLFTFGVRVETPIATTTYVCWSGQKFLSSVSEAKRHISRDPRQAINQELELEKMLGGLSAARGARPLSVLLSLHQAATEPPSPLELVSALHGEWLRARRASRGRVEES